MKSRFFKDTQGLGECYTRCPPGQVCICLRMDRGIYGQLLRQAGQYGMTSGQYIQQLMAWHGDAHAVCNATEEASSCSRDASGGCTAESLVLNRQGGNREGQGWERLP